MSLGSSGLNIGPGAGTSGLGASGLNGTFGSVLKTLQVDPNCIAIQDPSQVWGVQDFLPRRNFLTYSEDFSNAAWVKANSSATSTGLLETNGTGAHYLYWVTASNPVKANVPMVLKARIQGVGRGWCLIGIATGAVGTVSNYRVYVNLDTGDIGSSLSSGVINTSTTAQVSPAGGVDITIRATFTTVDASYSGCLIYSASADGTVSYTGDISKGVNAYNVMLCRADTIDQSYQKITDWTTEQYAWAAQKQVPWLRRNAWSSNTEDLSGWTKRGTATITANYAASPTGTITASRFAGIGAAGVNDAYKTAALSEALLGRSDIESAHTIYIKRVSTSGTLVVSNSVSSQHGKYTVDLSAIGDGWIRLDGAKTGVEVTTPWKIYTNGQSGFMVYCTSGAPIEFLAWGVQIEASASPTQYQPIGASWDATYAANAAAAGFNTGIWQDAGTNPVNTSGQSVYRIADASGKGYTANQATAANRPLWTLDANAKPYLLGDNVNDAMPVTFPASFSSNASVYVTTDAGTTVTDGVTLNGSYAPLVAAKQYARVVFKSGRPTYHEKLIRWLNAKAGL